MRTIVFNNYAFHTAEGYLFVNETPWEYNPALAEKRLCAISQELIKARHHALEYHDEINGDDVQLLGLRSYKWCLSTISSLAGSEGFEWLGVLIPNGRFTFTVDGTPVRFAKENDIEKIAEKRLVLTREAANQMSLLPVDDSSKNLLWFFIISQDFDLSVRDVTFVGYSQVGDVVCAWDVPIEDNQVSLMTGVVANLPEPEDADKPKVALKVTIKKQDEHK